MSAAAATAASGGGAMRGGSGGGSAALLVFGMHAGGMQGHAFETMRISSVYGSICMEKPDGCICMHGAHSRKTRVPDD